MGISMKKTTPIQASAKGEQCTFNLFCCNHDPETTVLCHDTRFVDSNSPRRCDARASYGCSECHLKMDSNELNPDYHGYVWGRAIAKTHVRLMEKGLLHLEGVEVEPIPKVLPRR